MNWLLLVVIVLGGTAIWPLGRWALKDNRDSGVVGFWVSLTVATICSVVVALNGEWHEVPTGVLVASGVFGVAYAFGFWICIMRALQIGPAGPTATINNMAMVAGVLYSMLILTPESPTIWTVVGLVGVCTSLILLGFGSQSENGKRHATGARWVKLITIGAAFSCMSFMAQTHAGTMHPDHKYLFGAVGFGLSALLLLPLMVRQPGLFRHRRELIGGLSLGVTNAAMLPLTLTAIRVLGAEVTLPIAIATPILLVLIIGRTFYQEHLSITVWTACGLGALSIAALAYGQ
jgi:drug/metabolite transporter (DMT)-like permease